MGNEAKIKKTFRYAHAEIQTRVVVICDPKRYHNHSNNSDSYS